MSLREQGDSEQQIRARLNDNPLPPASRADGFLFPSNLGFASLHPRLYADACSAG
jgi:hypothetical protein